VYYTSKPTQRGRYQDSAELFKGERNLWLIKKGGEGCSAPENAAFLQNFA
jgi:hypothetical protein